MKKIFIIAIVSTITATSLIISSCNGGSSNKADIDKVAAIYNEGIEQIKNAKDSIEMFNIFDDVTEKVAAFGTNLKDVVEFLDAIHTFLAVNYNISHWNLIYSINYPDSVIPYTNIISDEMRQIHASYGNPYNEGILILKEGLEQIGNAKDKNEADKIYDEVGVKTGDYVKSNIELRTYFAADDKFFKAYYAKLHELHMQYRENKQKTTGNDEDRSNI